MSGVVCEDRSQSTPVALRRESASASRLMRDSLAPSTYRNYTSALRLFRRWICRKNKELLQSGDQFLLEENDAALALYLGELDSPSDGNQPYSLAKAQMAVAAAKAASIPVGDLTAKALRGFARSGRSERGRGQSFGFTPQHIADMIALTKSAEWRTPRHRRHNVWEKPDEAVARAVMDAALLLVAYQGALRRSELVALKWDDLKEASDGVGLLLTVRKSKTNQTGQVDVRYLKDPAVNILREWQMLQRSGEDRVFPMTDRTANSHIQALARGIGLDVERLGITSHSCRVGVAQALIRAGASEVQVAHAGSWKSSAMVVHYSQAIRAENGAVAQFL